jgi:hypothetical protein
MAASVTVVKELQQQLLTREVELTRREEALIVWKEMARISEMTLVKVSADLDTE